MPTHVNPLDNLGGWPAAEPPVVPPPPLTLAKLHAHDPHHGRDPVVHEVSCTELGPCKPTPSRGEPNAPPRHPPSRTATPRLTTPATTPRCVDTGGPCTKSIASEGESGRPVTPRSRGPGSTHMVRPSGVDVRTCAADAVASAGQKEGRTHRTRRRRGEGQRRRTGSLITTRRVSRERSGAAPATANEPTVSGDGVGGDRHSIHEPSPSPCPPDTAEGESRHTPERLCAPGYRPRADTSRHKSGADSRAVANDNAADQLPVRAPTATSSAASTLVPFVSPTRETDTYYMTRYSSRPILAPLDVNCAAMAGGGRGAGDVGREDALEYGARRYCYSPSADRFLSETISHSTRHGAGGHKGCGGAAAAPLASHAATTVMTATAARGNGRPVVTATERDEDVAQASAQRRCEQARRFMTSRRSCSTLCPTDMGFLLGPTAATHTEDQQWRGRPVQLGQGHVGRDGFHDGVETEMGRGMTAPAVRATTRASDGIGEASAAAASLLRPLRMLVCVCVRVLSHSHDLRRPAAAPPHDEALFTVTLRERVDLRSDTCACILGPLRERLSLLLPTAASLDGQLLLTAADNHALLPYLHPTFLRSEVELTEDVHLSDLVDVTRLAEAWAGSPRTLPSADLTTVVLQWRTRDASGPHGRRWGSTLSPDAIVSAPISRHDKTGEEERFFDEPPLLLPTRGQGLSERGSPAVPPDAVSVRVHRRWERGSSPNAFARALGDEARVISRVHGSSSSNEHAHTSRRMSTRGLGHRYVSSADGVAWEAEEEEDDSVEVIRVSATHPKDVSAYTEASGRVHAQAQPHPRTAVRLVNHLVERCEESSLAARYVSVMGGWGSVPVMTSTHVGASAASPPTVSRGKASTARTGASVPPSSFAPSCDVGGLGGRGSLSSHSYTGNHSVEVVRRAGWELGGSPSPSTVGVMASRHGGGCHAPRQIVDDRITFLFDDGR